MNPSLTVRDDVKRFVNRLRFMAMRLRELNIEVDQAGQTPPFNKAALVAMAVTRDVNEKLPGAELNDLSTRIASDRASKGSTAGERFALIDAF